MATQNSFGITFPPIDTLLDQVKDEQQSDLGIKGSKFALASYASARAHQIVGYFSNMQGGLYSETFENIGPLVDYYQQEKPVSIAMREIQEGKLNLTPGGKKVETEEETTDALDAIMA